MCGIVSASVCYHKFTYFACTAEPFIQGNTNAEIPAIDRNHLAPVAGISAVFYAERPNMLLTTYWYFGIGNINGLVVANAGSA